MGTFSDIGAIGALPSRFTSSPFLPGTLAQARGGHIFSQNGVGEPRPHQWWPSRPPDINLAGGGPLDQRNISSREGSRNASPRISLNEARAPLILTIWPAVSRPFSEPLNRASALSVGPSQAGFAERRGHLSAGLQLQPRSPWRKSTHKLSRTQLRLANSSHRSAA